jgi:ParB-like chromosome segregation protein Spo0J
MESNIKIRCEFTKLVAVDELSPHPRNPRKHPSQQIKLLAKIIEHQGWRRAVVVSKRSGFIVAGHGAFEAARLLGCSCVPVDYQEFDNDEDEVAHLLADNEIAAMSGRDTGAVEELLKKLDEVDFDLELTGILEALDEPAKLEKLEYKKPPKMSYVLISIPTVKFGEINQLVEKIAENESAQVDTSVSDK